MSRIKEELIGYEDNDWIDYDDHVRVTEVEEYLFYAMSVAEMQQLGREHIKHDLYILVRSDFNNVY